MYRNVAHALFRNWVCVEINKCNSNPFIVKFKVRFANDVELYGFLRIVLREFVPSRHVLIPN